MGYIYNRLFLTFCSLIISVYAIAQEKDSLAIVSAHDTEFEPDITLNAEALEELSDFFQGFKRTTNRTFDYLPPLSFIKPMLNDQKKVRLPQLRWDIDPIPMPTDRYSSYRSGKYLLLKSSVSDRPAAGIEYIRNSSLEYKLTKKLSFVIEGSYTAGQGKRLPTYIYRSGVGAGLKLNIHKGIDIKSGGQWNQNIVFRRMEWCFLTSLIITF